MTKLYVYVDKTHPEIDLIYATTLKEGVELEVIEIDFDETDETVSIQELVKNKLGL